MTLTKRTVVKRKPMSRSNVLQHENDSGNGLQNDQAMYWTSDRMNGNDYDALNENDHVHAKTLDDQMGNSLQLALTQRV